MHYMRWRTHGDPEIKLTQGGNPAGLACSVCGDPSWGHGLCPKHWKRWRRHGDPLKTVNALPGQHRAFIDQAIAYTGDNCLLWPYGKGFYGYAAVKGGHAHPIVCEAVHGPKPEGMEVAHSCDNPTCIAPKHLRWATHAQNMADMALRGRSRKHKHFK